MQRVTIRGPKASIYAGSHHTIGQTSYIYESGQPTAVTINQDVTVPVSRYESYSAASVVSEVVPNYAKKLASGELIMNPYVSYSAEYKTSNFGLDEYTKQENTYGVSPTRVTTRDEMFRTYRDVCPAFKVPAIGSAYHPIDFSGDVNYPVINIQVSNSVAGPGDAARSKVANSLERWSALIQDFSAFNGCDLLALHQQATVRTLADLRRDSVNVYTSFGEIGKTVSLVGQLMRTLASLLFSFKRKILRVVADPAELRYILEELTSGANPRNLRTEWLKYRYGLRPLLYDLRGYLTILNRHFRYLRTRGHGFAALSAESYTSTFWSEFYFSDLKIHYKVDAGARFRGTAIADYDWADPLQATVFDFGLDRYLQAGWDLIPWSFLVDWFCNVSEWLDALGLGALEPLKKASCMSLKQSFTVEATVLEARRGQNYTFTGYSTHMLQHACTARVSVQAVQRFTPGLNMPDFPLVNSNIHLGALRVLDLVALGGQLRIR